MIWKLPRDLCFGRSELKTSEHSHIQDRSLNSLSWLPFRSLNSAKCVWRHAWPNITGALVPLAKSRIPRTR
jgi:hypothetical protein